MKKKKISPIRSVRGNISVPGDKSISHRAIMAGALAEGRTLISNILDCDDCDATIGAFTDMGVPIKRIPETEEVIVEGRGLRGLKRPKSGELFLGESGTTMRILAGIVAGQGFDVTLTGAEGLSRRPMQRIVEPLRLMGGRIRPGDDGLPPLWIHNGLSKPIEYKTKIASAQIKSSILFAGLFVDGITSVTEPAQSRDHTELMLRRFGAEVAVEGLTSSIKGPAQLRGQQVEIPGDISSAAFFMAAATILPGSRLTISHLGINPTRTGVIDVLKRMGADIHVAAQGHTGEATGTVTVTSSGTRGTVIEQRELPKLIDEIPVIMVCAALSEGQTVIRGARELRAKETDRIASMERNLTAMGASVRVINDDIIVKGVKSLRGARLRSFNDHRTAMSMVIAACRANGISELDDTVCISKSFPTFFSMLEKIAC